jgi:hypothetical protein
MNIYEMTSVVIDFKVGIYYNYIIKPSMFYSLINKPTAPDLDQLFFIHHNLQSQIKTPNEIQN